MTGPTSMSRPVSSLISRRTASCSDSPNSRSPPGSDHSPLRGSCARLTTSALPSRTTTAPTPTTGWAGYSLATNSFTDDLDQHTFVPPTVEFTVENLLPRTEVKVALGDCHNHFAP